VMAGRKTGAHPPLRPVPPAPSEPDGLSDREKEIFAHLVRSVDSDHFTESDVPIIVAYVQAIGLHERAMQALRRDGEIVVNGKGGLSASPWIVILEKSQRAMIGLSMRLRLSPASSEREGSRAEDAGLDGATNITAGGRRRCCVTLL
jgi:P27 family predicted phage terminase small subunit